MSPPFLPLLAFFLKGHLAGESATRSLAMAQMQR